MSGYPAISKSSDGTYPTQVPFATDILTPPAYNGPQGFLLNWDPTKTGTNQFQVSGTDSQVLQVTLQPGEFCVTEPGAMLYKADTIKMSTGMGGCCAGVKRCLGGESMFRNKYTNKGNAPAVVSITPNYPSKIVPIDLSRSGVLFAHPGVYLAHIGEVKVSFEFVANPLAGCFAGAGFLMLKLQGTGTVFLSGGGSVMEKTLAPGEKLLVDTHSLLGFASTAKYGVQLAGGCMACCCGGEGMFNTSVTGPGIVLIHSMSLSRMRAALSFGKPGASRSLDQ